MISKALRIFRKGFKIVLMLIVCVIAVVASGLLWLRYSAVPPLPQTTLLHAVSNVKATEGRGTVTLTWDEVPGAIGYQVLRSDNSRDFIVAGAPYGYYSGPLQAPIMWDRFISRLLPGHFGRLPRPPFTDTAVQSGHTYYYRVRATDSVGWTALTAPVRLRIAHLDEDPPLTVSVNASNQVGLLEHKWEMAIGSEHLSYMLKQDIDPHLTAAGRGLRAGNKLAHDELGMRYVVSHSILNDDLNVYTEDKQGQPRYDFSHIDTLYDEVLADGLKPYVQLDFMPSTLAVNPGAVHGIFRRNPAYLANDSPPKDYGKWGQLVSAFAAHLIQRYGKTEVESWPFAVWNEPDVCFWFWPACYWKGDPEAYYQLYDYAAVALKSVDPQLRVGGPVTLLTNFVEPFLRHITTHNYVTGGNTVPLDFLDVRIYMQDAANWKPLLTRYGFDKLPVYYSEWGVRELEGDPVNDMPFGAAWLISSLCRSLDNVDSISYWTGSDYFEEHGQPSRFFHGGFGLIGLDGVRKSRYWAYYLLHQLGTQRLALSGDGDGFNTLVNGWATRDDDGTVRVILSNSTTDQSNARGNAALDRDVRLKVTGLISEGHYKVRHFRIDNTHSNPYRVWLEMGSPAWPNAAELARLHQGDALEMLQPESDLKADEDGALVVDFQLPMPAVSFLAIAPETRTRSAHSTTVAHSDACQLMHAVPRHAPCCL
jgi:xylan 1,4-beta-xylosidase